ncbi:tyrosine-protein phosphatase [Xylocopilactobacillus apicola]|uniref:Protein-tyrosine-phosphatase n=1 Tax=Xylocopilactobacillus apicola TaxID=2932184 RepID=A0AAU9D297_9LACO|nr:tyrosine-protein phosphatase [Xylocopilactobacillus apicola]BDR58896.1 protein-tyrosine-phosphatase [Xylocopilactobacillus apicola]
MSLDYVEAFFLKDGQNELHLQTEDKIAKYKLYWTEDLDRYTKNKHFLLESEQKKLKFEFNYNSQKVNYFIIEWPKQDPILFGYRILPLAGMYNFRDIGGYLTEDGRRIKWGVGYRSDFLTNLRPAGEDFFKSLKIKSIIDYRSPSEIAADPNPVIDPKIKNFQFDPEADTAREAGKLQSMKATQSLKERAQQALAQGQTGIQKMINQQLAFVTSPNSHLAFAKSLKIIGNAQNLPSMQHCRGGKDRTGFALMLLEGLLGVPKQTLIYDYLLTERARAEKNQRYYQYFLKETNDEQLAGYLYSLYDTRAEFIEASIDKIITNYGSFSNYAIEVLKLQAKDLQNLKTNFLED